MRTHRPPDQSYPPRILYYSPKYLVRSQRFIWQQARDLNNTEVVTRELLETAAEFPHPALSILRPQSRALRSFDFRTYKLAERMGFPKLDLHPIEALRLATRMRSVDIAYTMFLHYAFDLLQAAQATKTPLVVHAAGSDVTTASFQGESYVAKVRNVFDQAQLILCGSSFLRERVVALGCPADKAEVHYLGIDIPEPTERRPKDASEPIQIAAVSRLHKVKGLDHTIRAFALARESANITLVIAGDGPEREALATLAASLDVAEHITFVGEISHTEVYRLLRESDIFAQHNVTTDEGAAEGLGGTLLEAAAHGLPVIATSSGGTPEALVDNETGFLVAEGAVEHMARRISELAIDPQRRIDMGQHGRAFVATAHNAQSQTAKLQERLASLGASR